MYSMCLNKSFYKKYFEIHNQGKNLKYRVLFHHSLRGLQAKWNTFREGQKWWLGEWNKVLRQKEWETEGPTVDMIRLENRIPKSFW